MTCPLGLTAWRTFLLNPVFATTRSGNERLHGHARHHSGDRTRICACGGCFEGEPVQSNTMWTLASLIKPVFVYGVLQLVQQGNLDRPLQTYLPQPYLSDSMYLPEMTARHAIVIELDFRIGGSFRHCKSCELKSVSQGFVIGDRQALHCLVIIQPYQNAILSRR